MVRPQLGTKTQDSGKQVLDTTRRLELLRRSIQKRTLDSSFHMQYEGQFKRLVHSGFNKKEPLELVHLTDVQDGNIASDIKRQLEFRDWVLSVPNRYMLWGGDMTDSGTKVSVGSPWEQLFEPQGQMWNFCERWAPAAHRVLAYVGGNHERRTVLTFGDLGQSIATILGIPYSNGQQLVDIHHGQHKPFKISLWHGRGAARSPGAKMNMLAEFMKDGDSQLYLVGHLHEFMTRYYSRKERAPDGSIKMVKVGGAMSSSFLQYWGTYAEVANMQASPLMMARCILYPDGKWEMTER